MASAIVIPIIFVAIIGLVGYFVYRFVIYDFLSRRSVSQTLRKYKIKKTPFEIIKEYHIHKGENLSDKEIHEMEKDYRQREPQQFLAMYDALREKQNSNESNRDN